MKSGYFMTFLVLTGVFGAGMVTGATHELPDFQFTRYALLAEAGDLNSYVFARANWMFIELKAEAANVWRQYGAAILRHVSATMILPVAYFCLKGGNDTL